jgi:hypothetical protein
MIDKAKNRRNPKKNALIIYKLGALQKIITNHSRSSFFKPWEGFW